MCWICDNKSSIAETYWADKLGLMAHFEASTAFEIDFIGDKLGDGIAPPALVTVDTIPDDISSTATIEVDGAHIISTIDTIGDQDFFQVELEAGGVYQIGQYAYVGGPSGVPQSDAYIEIYDASGNFVVSADGGGPNTPSGLDALLTFVAEESGTYYINARSFDNLPENGTTGDEVGDYELFVDQVDPSDPGVYVPYYDVDSPLYAIDWGTQVNRVHESVRNPDGDEGTRDTGNPQGELPPNEFNITDKNVVTIYFAQAGDVFTSIEDPTNPGLPPVLVSAGTQDWEKDVVMTALGEFEKVADVTYRVVDTREEADFFFTTYAGTPGPGISLLGSMSPPDYPDEGLAQFNSGDYRWTEENLQQGGFSYVTLIHEFGHGHGLAHPHDNGGNSGIMHGVEQETATSVANYTTGDFNLNQGVNTMMSYEDGWQTSPYGNAPTDVGYGYLGGLMAFDIAAIQDKYGVNEDWATGNDTYVLKDVNAAGTFYSSIWDGGGMDRIVYTGARNSTIDLRPATLQYEHGGGGHVSYAFGIFGGFTIANGVTVEDARSGAGDDLLIGNDVANMLEAGRGLDVLRGENGDDLLIGGLGADEMRGGRGDDVYHVDAAGDQAIELDGRGHDRVTTFVDLVLADNVEDLYLYGDARAGTGNLLANHVNGSDSDDVLIGLGGSDLLAGGIGSDELSGDFGWDTIVGGIGHDTLSGEAGNDTLSGGANRDTLFGGDGDDRLEGGTEIDVLNGGAGADMFLFDDGDTGSTRGEADTIADFGGGDRINLRGIDADTGTGADDAFTFVGQDAFSGTAGELRYELLNGNAFVQGDVNGDGTADFFVQLNNVATVDASDFLI